MYINYNLFELFLTKGISGVILEQFYNITRKAKQDAARQRQAFKVKQEAKLAISKRLKDIRRLDSKYQKFQNPQNKLSQTAFMITKII